LNLDNCSRPSFGKIVRVITDPREILRVRIITGDFDLYIGIDPGVQTGVASWLRRDKKLLDVSTSQIHKVMRDIDRLVPMYGQDRILVRVEDARLRTWIPKERGREALQGVGSVKRDAQIWEEFLSDLGIAFELLAPAAGRTKWSDEYFKKLTGWKGRTSNHARDAAALVFGL
jgi:hypothetical protein